MLAIAWLLVAAASVPAAQARRCYDSYGRYYYCSGLSYGARIGIGVGIAAAVLAVFALCGVCRRRQLQQQFQKYRPPILPQTSNPGNPYANNPPPPPVGTYPAGGADNNTNWNQNAYGYNVPEPASTYQPSMAGQYKAPEPNEAAHEHGYEWEQAREQERLERLQAENNGSAQQPPSYDTASAQQTGSSQHYAPPPGPPPAKTN